MRSFCEQSYARKTHSPDVSCYTKTIPLVQKCCIRKLVFLPKDKNTLILMKILSFSVAYSFYHIFMCHAIQISAHKISYNAHTNNNPRPKMICFENRSFLIPKSDIIEY